MKIYFLKAKVKMILYYAFTFKGLVSGSCIAGFCYCLHFTQIQQLAIKDLVWCISDKNHTKRARITKGWFKYMTDCKNFPDHLTYSSRNDGRMGG
jgi:hypothetical protein